LKGTLWGEVTIRDVLEMASGMEGSNESYTDPKNKHYQYEASLGWQPITPEMPESVRQEDTHERQYRDTRVAARRTQPQRHCGCAQRTDLVGNRSVGGCAHCREQERVAAARMITTLRDLARFGLLFTPSCRTQTISDRFLRRITQNGRPGLVKDWRGQILFIAPEQDVVIAHLGTNKTLDDVGPMLNLGSLIDDLF
jgi:hypothetical protein